MCAGCCCRANFNDPIDAVCELVDNALQATMGIEVGGQAGRVVVIAASCCCFEASHHLLSPLPCGG